MGSGRLRKRLLLLAALVFLGLLVADGVIKRFVLYNAFVTADKEAVIEDRDRIVDAVEAIMGKLHADVTNISLWLAADPGARFLDETLTVPRFFQINEIDILVYDDGGETARAVAARGNVVERIPLEDNGFVSAVREAVKRELSDEGSVGFVVDSITGRPYIMASRVLPGSDDSSEPPARVSVGKEIDGSYVESFKRSLIIDALRVTHFGGDDTPVLVPILFEGGAWEIPDTTGKMDRLEEDSEEGKDIAYLRIAPLTGNRPLVLVIERSWTYRPEGSMSLIFSSLYLLVVYGTLISILIIWVNRNVAGPLIRLKTVMEEWDGIRIPNTGRLRDRGDEIGVLTKSFVRMAGEIRSKTRSLEEQASRDGLTGLLNRRRFDEIFAAEWKRNLRNGKAMAVVIGDIDYFKNYNDSLGHVQGDDCLRIVARVVGSGVQRPGDFAFRYGGEEFALVLSDTDGDGAQMVAERVRQRVEKLLLEHPDSPVSPYVTMSLGYSHRLPVEEEAQGGLLAEADEALYRAKTGGRNRINGFDG